MKQPIHAAPRGARRRLLLACAPLACLLASVLAVACSSTKEPAPGGGSAAIPAAPNAPRLDPAAIDETQLVVLPRSTHPAVSKPGQVVGRVPRDTRIDYMQLVLKRSPEQEAGLTALIDALHDKTSPRYHQWLGVEEFADQYGVAQADLGVIVGWLQGHGFRVDHVAPSRMFVEFSGTIGAIEDSFHTPMGALEVKGVPHIANLRDPQIPAELAKAVVGVYALNDFMPHVMHKKRGAVQRDHATGTWRVTRPSPDFTFSLSGCSTDSECATGQHCNANGSCSCTTATDCAATPSGAAATCTSNACVACRSNADCSGPATCNTATNVCEETFYGVAPADFATIYNEKPLFSAGLTGAGETVAVLEDSLLANPADVATFRAAFGLSGYPGTFTQLTATGTAATCTSSGVTASEGEAALDAEWAGSTAPGAAIELASCRDNATTFGGLVALENLLSSANPPSVVSISYGLCEADDDDPSNAAYVNAYQQAVTAGVSVFVSAGDEGAASCDADQTVATHGIAVSGFASTPYNVAVGGTDFMDYYDSVHGGPAVATYWNATNTAAYGSALSYIPEIPWDNSCASPLVWETPAIALGTYTQAYGATGFCNSTYGQSFRTTASGGGGPSTVSAQPSWQTGVVGLPSASGGMRALPDVSLFAANGVFGHFLLFCMSDANQGGGPCTYTNAGDAVAQAAGGTSFAAPSMAGIQAIINQKAGSKQGNPNYAFYALAATEYGATGNPSCDSSGGAPGAPVLPAASCIFNDVTAGTMAVNCTGANCYGAAGADQGVLSTSTSALDPGYNAGTGWDYATGLGTINAYNLVEAAGGCVVGGKFYAAGTVDPTNACLVCTPATSSTAFSDAPNGKSCGAGEICDNGACTAGCFIAGAYYAAGAPNPQNPCQTCQPATSTTAFSSAPNGTSATCPAGDVCDNGACTAGCFIAGAYYAAGAPNPQNPCQTCQPATSTTAFSSAPNGTSATCPAGDVCDDGACTAGCFIAGAYYAAGAPNPQNPCQTCQPATSTTAFSSAPNGTSATCPAGDVCDDGACTAGCFIAGAYYAAGAVDPSSACQVCAPASSTIAWSSEPDGSACSIGTCTGGVCTARSDGGTVDGGALDSGRSADSGASDSDGGSGDGGSRDAGESMDSGLLEDAGNDGESASDSGFTSDASSSDGATDGSSPGSDGAVADGSSEDGGDGGAASSGSSGGCGCRVTGSAPQGRLAAAPLLGLALLLRRRRRANNAMRTPLPTATAATAATPVAAVLAVVALSCGGTPAPPPACAAAPTVTAPASASASAVAAPAPNEQELLSLLKRRSQEFSDASATNDVAVLERDLDDRVVFINESGETATKKDLLSDPTPHPENAGTLVQTDFAVQLHGSVAVTSFTDNLTRPFHGQTFHASFRSTEVWLLEADGWRMISSQTLAVQADPPAITLPSKTLDEYVGTYEAGHDYVFKITRSGAELSGVRGAGEPFPIKAEVADVLFTPGDPRMRRIIVRDAKGKVTGLIARRDGHDITLTRVG